MTSLFCKFLKKYLKLSVSILQGLVFEEDYMKLGGGFL